MKIFESYCKDPMTGNKNLQKGAMLSIYWTQSQRTGQREIPNSSGVWPLQESRLITSSLAKPPKAHQELPRDGSPVSSFTSITSLSTLQSLGGSETKESEILWTLNLETGSRGCYLSQCWEQGYMGISCWEPASQRPVCTALYFHPHTRDCQVRVQQTNRINVGTVPAPKDIRISAPLDTSPGDPPDQHCPTELSAMI